MVSGAVWLVATFIQNTRGVGAGFTALFLGGMLIYPIAKLVCRTVFKRDGESSSNPFGMIVLEGTFAMIGGLFAAWLFLALRPELVFPLAAVAVGTHYFIFKTAYGSRSFWILAGIVTATGVGDIFATPMRGSTALLVALTELAFGLVLTFRARGDDSAIVAPVR